MLDAEDLAKMNSPEAPIVQGLMKLQLPGLARSGYAPQPIEIKSTLEIPVPALGVGPNGVAQRRETVAELASRIMSAEEASNDFEKFALMFSVGLDRGGRMQSIDIIDGGIAPIAENAGYDIRFKDNPESNLIYGIYFVQQYYRAMINSDNSSAKFVKLMEQVATDVEDFRLDRPEVLEVLHKYPMAEAVFKHFTDPKTVYALQSPTPKIDIRLEYERILGFIRQGLPIPRLGVPVADPNLNIPGRYPGEPLSFEAEAQLGYAIVEAMGWRDAINHRKATRNVVNPGPPPIVAYGWEKNETESHIFGAPLVADPFSAVARPREFAMYVKQRLGKEVGHILGLDTLDVGWRTYGAEVLKRSIARNQNVHDEMQWEEQATDRMATKDPFNLLGPNHNIDFPPASLINGRPPVNPNVDYVTTHNRYPEGTVINGVDLGGQEISVGMVRNIKKYHKGSDIWTEMYSLYLNPYAKVDEALVKAVNAAADYAREAFDDVLTHTQSQEIVPKITSAVMKISAKRGMPVSDEIIKRTLQAQIDDLGMHSGVGGFFSARVEKFKMDFRRGEGEARASSIAPRKGESNTDALVDFAKVFFSTK